MPETFPRGRICWHELLTTDPQAAIGFYKKSVGWGTQAWDQDPSYVMWTVKGTPIGGLMVLPEAARKMGAPPSWLMHVAVPDVDATVRQATSLDASTYVPPRDIPTVGRFAVLADPQGATFAVFTPATTTPGHDGPALPGEFSWHELATTDWRAAWSFYERLFGWTKLHAMDMGPAGTYQMFGRMGQTLGGVYNKPREMTAPPHWLCYVLVSSADGAVPLVTRLGGTVVNGPMEVPGGDRIAMCVDPQGAAFAVHARAARAPAAARAKRPARKVAKKRPPKKRPARKKPAARRARPRRRR